MLGYVRKSPIHIAHKFYPPLFLHHGKSIFFILPFLCLVFSFHPLDARYLLKKEFRELREMQFAGRTACKTIFQMETALPGKSKVSPFTRFNLKT